MIAWTDGRFIEGKAPLDSFAYPLHYSGPCAWEGMRSYVQRDGTCRIYKLEEHVARLLASAKILGMKIPHKAKDISAACVELVQKNGNDDFYLRPIAFVKGDAEGIHTNAGEVRLDIYCLPIPKLHKAGKDGIKMVISNVVRSYPQFQMQIKTPANYSVLCLIKPLLEQTGADDAFVSDAQGHVVEATVANFFVVKGDVIMTPPNHGSILPGITRQSVAEILLDRAGMFSKYGLVPTMVEKPITRADLYTADCVFLTGTYAEVVKVAEIDGRKVSENDFYFRLVKEEYKNLVRGPK